MTSKQLREMGKTLSEMRELSLREVGQVCLFLADLADEVKALGEKVDHEISMREISTHTHRTSEVPGL